MRVLVVLAVTLGGCGGAEPAGDPATPTAPSVAAPAGDPAEVFGALETRLLEADRLRFEFAVSATGAVEAELGGTVDMSRDVYDLSFDGTFSGQPMAPELSLRDGIMRGGSSQGRFEEPAPPGLREAIVIGLTRMGLLHNVATLAGGQPPDRSDGTVTEWVVVSDIAWGARRADDRAALGIDFTIQVGGEPAGEVTLYLDPDTHLPFRRDQVVHFDQSDMRVVERYRNFTVE